MTQKGSGTKRNARSGRAELIRDVGRKSQAFHARSDRTPASRSEVLWGAALVCGTLLFRPLRLWADNPWDLSSPQDLVAPVVAGILIATVLFGSLAKVTGRPYTASLAIGGLVFAVLNWASFESGVSLALLGTITLGAVYTSVRAEPRTVHAVVLACSAMVVVIPGANLALSHWQDRQPYPLLEPNRPKSAGAGASVEDILLVIVDGYPMSALAHDWFGHDTEPLREILQESGFATPTISWSHNTFTNLALPTILQLDQVTDDSPKGVWGNQKPSYDIIRGESLTVGLLREAGYRYTHLESGWNGDSCGSADACFASSWLNEATWKMLSTSIAYGWMRERWSTPNVRNSLEVRDRIVGLDLFDDGARDFVYAHLMLPHSPFVVDEQCRLTDGGSGEEPSRVAAQLSCVDSILADILDKVGSDTAVIIAGDHGTGTRGQVWKPPIEWDDADIAERLGAFLTYRLPESCPEPKASTNTSVTRALVSCVTGTELPDTHPAYLLGLTDQVVVAKDRLEAVGVAIQAEKLTRDS